MSSNQGNNRHRGPSRKPRAASAILKRTLGAYRLSSKVDEYAAFPQWPEIVGDELAAVAVPEKILRGKVLVVRVADAAWAQELSMQKTAILDRMYDSGLGGSLEDIQFITGSPKSFKR